MQSNTLTPDFTGFITEAQSHFKHRIYTDYLRRFAYGTDASCYRYVPRVVVWAFDESEIVKLFALSRKYNTPLTFRAAGTSLSGQACSDSVLVLANARWQNISIQDNASSIVCDCGVIGSEANEALKPFRKKIGPDPATINNAMIGGIFSNNSSGMCCGVKQNSYNTIKSVRVILHDGFVLDTSARAKSNENIQSFLTHHKDKANALLALRDEILKSDELPKLIRRKFAIKNTTGYSINTLLDFSDIKDILNHIFIGAEGTLGFVSQVEYECVDDYTFKACALLFYENLKLAAKAVRILAENEDIVSAAELMDYACLKSAQHLGDIDKRILNVKQGQCTLLVQLEDSTLKDLESKINTISQALKVAPSLFGENFSTDEKQMASWWKIRKGLLPLSASLRPSGSIVITEDICFEIESFAQGIEEITRLFAEFNFEGIIFGHALSGNVHFIITPNLNDKDESARFGAFMEAMVDSVLSLGGSTKAEHGTGRMIAPFVEREWGKSAYAINQKIKSIFDPHNLINPDVIITNDARIHLKNLKHSSEVEDFINQCMECGFCEKVCPSKELTLTPRQRIAVRKEIKRLENLQSKSLEEEEWLKELKEGYVYFGIDTCATCSMCATLCPLEIDSAKIALTLKPTLTSNIAQFIASNLGKHFGSTLALAKAGLKFVNMSSHFFGANTISKWSKTTKNLLRTPYIPTSMPHANEKVYFGDSVSKIESDKKVIYFSTCINRVLAPSIKALDKRPLQEVFESLCKKAGINIIYPHNITNLCCGKAFKDYPKTSEQKAQELYEALKTMKGSEETIDIVCDHSACSYELIQTIKHKQDLQNISGIKVFDMPEYIANVLLERLRITPLNEDIALYAICATKKGGWDNTLDIIAKACTNGNIIKHTKTQCCGFAGNKGFICPELNESALRELSEFYVQKKQVDKHLRRGFASSSTCEIGLNDKTNIIWQNLLYLVDEVSESL